MYVDSQPVPPADVVAALAAHASEQAAAREGAPPAWTVLTVPPTWGEHRRGLLTEAVRATGVEHFSLESSAVTVTRHHRGTAPLPDDATVAVYDLGASTLDTAVVRTTGPGTIETLCAPLAPLPWGGRDLDDAVVDLVRSCLSSEVDGDTTAAIGSPAEFRRTCVAAKEQLSRDTDTRLEVRAPGGPLSLRLVREDLDELIAESVHTSVGAVRDAVAAAGLEVADLAAVVLAGGSAAVPLVAETLSAELGRPVVVDEEPALTAALGAAELALDRVLAEEVRHAPATDGPGGGGGPAAVTVPRRPSRPRAGSRPPVPTGSRGRRSHRVGQRLLVVVAASLALSVGLAAFFAAGWTGGPVRAPSGPGPAAAQPSGTLGTPVVAGHPQVPEGLSPAAADRPDAGSPATAARSGGPASGAAPTSRGPGSTPAAPSGSASGSPTGAAARAPATAVGPGTPAAAGTPGRPAVPGSPQLGTDVGTEGPAPSAGTPTPGTRTPAPPAESIPAPVEPAPGPTGTSTPPVVEPSPPSSPGPASPPEETAAPEHTTPPTGTGTPPAAPPEATPGATA
jgi:actin-like ATPase involved in cell morphogenesis